MGMKRFRLPIVSIILFFIIIIVYKILISRFSVSETTEIIQNEPETILNQVQKKIQDEQNKRPMPEEDLRGKNTYENGAIRIVKENSFSQVAEKPKSPMETLMEMAGGKKDKSPVRLNDSDLNKKINLYERMSDSESLKVANVPQLGEEPKTRISKIYAPVTYKVFQNEKDWNEFVKFNKFRDFKPDFSNSNVIILVSNSDLPNGIFFIDSVKTEKNIASVYYRINPLEMASNNENKNQNHYSAANVPKGAQIKLIQIEE